MALTGPAVGKVRAEPKGNNVTSTTENYEYSGKVTATVSLPDTMPGQHHGPPLVFIDTERLGYIPLTVNQAEQLAENLTAIVESLRSVGSAT